MAKGLTTGDVERIAPTPGIDAMVLARLRAPFGAEYIPAAQGGDGRWRIHDANDDAIASVSFREEGYARLIVEALNAYQSQRDASGYNCAGCDVALAHTHDEGGCRTDDKTNRCEQLSRIGRPVQVRIADDSGNRLRTLVVRGGWLCLECFKLYGGK